MWISPDWDLGNLQCTQALFADNMIRYEWTRGENSVPYVAALEKSDQAPHTTCTCKCTRIVCAHTHLYR